MLALRYLAAAVLAVGTAFVSLHDWLGLGGPALDPAAEGPAYDAVILAAGITCIARSRSAGRERGAWLAIGASILAWGAAEVYWYVAILDDPSPPYPSPADAGYLAFYPLAVLGLLLLVRARVEEIDWRLWMDGAIAALGAAALGAAFVFDFAAAQTSGAPIGVATSLAYPLGDIVVLAMVVGIVALTGWRPGRAWTPLLLGIAAMSVADVAYTLQSTDLGLPEGIWMEPIYLVAAAFLGIAAWQSRSGEIRSRPRSSGWRELIVPALFAGVMLGLFGMQFVSTTSSLSTVLWAATMVAVIVRLAIGDRENRALLEQVRTDPLTGLGSRGSLQVDLDQRCASATELSPIAVALFDLNGFKRFNDTFGHPEGDELLARLGRRLREALGDDGLAFRVGGDEFCVILVGPSERFDSELAAAASALTWSERGVDVSASWGMAKVPKEAGSPRDALQLADLRMYAQKESRPEMARHSRMPVGGQAGRAVAPVEA
jgi:diguanylate cyclase (GGDEF)-like protein